MNNSLELRLIAEKHLSNLLFEFMERFQDQSSILERYIRGELALHVHFVKPSGIGCFLIEAEIDADLTLESRHYQSPVLIRVGQISQNSRPLTTRVRLQEADSCLVFDRESIESPDMRLPSLFLVFDRKLRILLDVSRVQDGKFINEVIESGPKVVDRLSDQDWDERSDLCWTLNFNVDGSSTITLRFPDAYCLAVIGEQWFNPREVFFCPVYSREGMVQRWRHSVLEEYAQLQLASRQDGGKEIQ